MSKPRTLKLTPAKPAFELATRYMAPTLEVVIYDTLVDRTADTGVRITIKSPQSVEARDAARAYRATITTDGDLTPDQVDGLFLAQVSACTVAWDGFTHDGAVLECTPDNVRALYDNPACGWIYQQVLAAFLDTSRFFATPRAS